MYPNITSFYAGILALVFLVISARVIQGRFIHKVSVGDGDNKDMRKRMRVQANFAEYTPLGIILLLLLDLQGANGFVMHVLGLALVAGRILHSYGMSQAPQVIILRRAGVLLTFAMIAGGAILNISYAIL